jgi:hypothetical protein
MLESLRLDLDSSFRIFELKMTWYFLIRTRSPAESFAIKLTNAGSPTVLHEIKATVGDFKEIQSNYLAEIRRGFLNDVFMVLSRYCILLNNVLRRHSEPFPELNESKVDDGPRVLNRFLSKEDKRFCEFFTILRNSLIHYDGNHNQFNRLNHMFCDKEFKTTADNLGKQIGYDLSDILEIFNVVRRIFSVDHLSKHQQFCREIQATSQ